MSRAGRTIFVILIHMAHPLKQLVLGRRCVPTHQMLTVLRAESWLSFDQSDLDELERLILEEAADVYGEPADVEA